MSFVEEQQLSPVRYGIKRENIAFIGDLSVSLKSNSHYLGWFTNRRIEDSKKGGMSLYAPVQLGYAYSP